VGWITREDGSVFVTGKMILDTVLGRNLRRALAIGLVLTMDILMGGRRSGGGVVRQIVSEELT
jgi:hypothetical protein